ncbi:proton-coupled folate transporter-like isoform X2 [Plodia interpunctella]|uniref:proton-coupled folate transporter-like isoform X2 n=1 Tax=Plodia interpunctella TaxID=58824 RepID=UPI002368A0C2|nr:proton-coupled folate transporter-like isoform X2 [Plodia interpunctella]
MSANEKKLSPEEEPLKEDAAKKTKKTLSEHIRYIKTNITVEPVLAGLIIPSMLSRLAIQNLNLDKACRVKLDLGDEICDALVEKRDNYSLSHYEGDVQRIISEIESWRSIIQTAIPTLLVIFMGAWSDRTGNRKLCILMPLFGELFVALSNILSTFYFREVSVEVTMFLESIFPAITGGWVMVYLGVFSYISDITTEESRTFRVGLANLCMTAGVPLGTALSGILLKLWGYYGIFFLSSVIYIANIIYALKRLKSNSKPSTTDTEKKNPPTFKDLTSMVKETIAVAFKKREGNFRKKIIVTLAIVTIIYGPNHGERIITYMYVRYRLRWDALKYSMYSTYSIIMHSIGALFSISVFSKRLGYHDSNLCLISVVSKLVGSVYIAFVQTDVQMYLVPIVEILNATTFTSLRSLASKLVPNEESGKMNSLFSLVETLGALMFDPTYSTIYSHTVNKFTGTVYIFSAVMTLPVIAMLMVEFTQS